MCKLQGSLRPAASELREMSSSLGRVRVSRDIVLNILECGDGQQDVVEDLSTDEDSSTQATSDDATFSQTTTPDLDPLQHVQPQLVISSNRRQVLLATAPDTPNSDAVARHTMHFVIRVLKSWPRIMAAHDTAHLPPIIHRLQLTHGTPTPLANCYTLVKMWAAHTDGSRDLVQKTILQEVQRLIREHHTYNETDILAAAQSLLVLLVILLLCVRQGPVVVHPADAQLLIDVWDVKQHLAATGLFLEQESDHALPAWEQWAIVSAKRRTILGLHHLEWAWSVLHGYPTLTCFELGPLPAPAARYLWRETDEETWARLYHTWLRQWKDGSYKMGEFFDINPGADLDARGEMWLAEADEFGMMLMAEVNTTGNEEL
ncbi:hypothetical protein AK830_g3546 [Neonectria ditissima]|uniref:Transcription factor domain-containing protein n=1 Tax=Neonectria ditissima TaxID=78410 RepID=A0A0P7AYD6_9HYPO|nr:hypothetical protein AK830_g3546 [Neonectria ditissima]